MNPWSKNPRTVTGHEHRFTDVDAPRHLHTQPEPTARIPGKAFGFTGPVICWWAWGGCRSVRLPWSWWRR